MLDNLPMELATIIEDMARSAYERGLQVGEQRVMKGLSAVAHLNGSANRILKALPADDVDTILADDPKPGAPHDDEPADVHAAVLQAMVEHAEQSINNGEDPTDGVHALLDLLEDPDQLAEVLGTKNDTETVQKSLYWLVLKSWSEDLHPRDDNGRFVSKDKLQEAKSDPKVAAELRKRVTKPEQRAKLDKIISGEADPGRTKRGQAKHEAGQRRQAKRLASLEAKRLVGKIMDGAGTAEDVEAIAGHINSGLNRDQIGYLGVLAQQAKGGGRRREEMVSALLDHVRGIVTPKDKGKPKVKDKGEPKVKDKGDAKTPTQQSVKDDYRSFYKQGGGKDIHEFEDIQKYIGSADAGKAALAAFSSGAFTEINENPDSDESKAVLDYVSKIPNAEVDKIHRVIAMPSEDDRDEFVHRLNELRSEGKPFEQERTFSSWTKDDPVGTKLSEHIGRDVASQFGEHEVYLEIENPKSAKDVSFIYGDNVKDGTEYLLTHGSKLTVKSVKKVGNAIKVVFSQKDNRADAVGTDAGKSQSGKPRSQEQGSSGMQRMKQQTAETATAPIQSAESMMDQEGVKEEPQPAIEQHPPVEDLHAKVLESLNHPLKWREGEVLPQAATPRKMIDNAHAVSGGNSRYSAMARMTTDQGWTTDGKYAVRSTPEMIEQAKKKGFDKLEGRIPVMDDVIPTKGYVQPASIVAHRLDLNGKHVVIIQGDEKAKNQQIADANYIANIRSIYPNATMHVHDNGMVIFKDNGQNVGIVMPMTGSIDTSKIVPEISKPQEMSEYLEPSPYGAESVRRVHNGLQFHGANIQITGNSKSGYEVPQYTGRTFATYQQAENFARGMLSYAHGADENGKLIFKPKGDQTELQGTDKDKKEYYQQLREKIQQTKPIKREKVTVTGHDGKDVERDLIHLNDHFAIRQDTPSWRDKNPKGYTVIHTPTGDTVSTGWSTQKDAIGHVHVLGGLGVDWGNWDSGKMKAESPEEFERVKQRFTNATTAYENDDYHPDMAAQQSAAAPNQSAESMMDQEGVKEESPGSQLGKKLSQHMTNTIAKLNAGDPDIGTGHKDLINEIAAKHGKQGLIDAALAYDETKPHEEERQRKMFGRMSQEQLAKHLHDSTQGRIDTMFRLAAGGEDIPLTHELMRRAAARQQQLTPTSTGASDNATTAAESATTPAPAPVPAQSISDADVKNRVKFGSEVKHNGISQVLGSTIAEGGDKYKKGHVEVAMYRGEHGGKPVYRWQENRDGNHQSPVNVGQWSESHAQAVQDAYDHTKANVPDAKIADEKFHRQFGDEATRAQIAESDAVKSAAAEQSKKQQAEKVSAMMKYMKKMKTSQGERYLHEFEADKGFWDNGHKKHGMDFVYPKKDPDGVWRVKIWGQTPQQTQQAIDKLKSMGAYPNAPTPTPAPTPAPKSKSADDM